MPRQQTLGMVIVQEKTANGRAVEARNKIAGLLGSQKLYSGLIKTYRPYKEGDGVFRAPEQTTRVQVRVEADLFRLLKETAGPAMDLAASKDWANTEAKADIEVGGTVLAAQVPATYLLYLEHRLNELAAVLELLPVLDSAEKWEADATEGIWRAAEPDRTIREEKDEVPSVGHEGNEHHPPQVRWVTKSVPTGEYSTVKFSGAVEPRRKEELLRRVHEVKQAVHRARERANQAPAPEVHPGSELLAYLLA